MIDGKEVSEIGGNPHGMFVSVDLREKKVTSVNNLTTQHYQKSDYALETDTKRLITLAERGGTFGPYAYDIPAMQQEKTVEVKLGTPKRILLKYLMYRDNENQELIVPGLSFPVMTPQTDTMWLPKQVVVPLVKDMLDEIPPPGVMPMKGGSIPPDGVQMENNMMPNK